MTIQWNSSPNNWGKIKMAPGSKLTLDTHFTVSAEVFGVMSREEFVDRYVALARARASALYDSVKVKGS